jgi:hypothetical protein
LDDSEVLRDLISMHAQIPLSMHYSKYTLELLEPGVASSVIIRNVPADTVAIKADRFSSPDHVFQGNKGECKRADFILISEEKRRIIFIEMKKTKAPFQEIVKQLKGASCFIAYCQHIGMNFWSQAKFLSNYEHRFVSIGHTSIVKNKTRVDKGVSVHDTPENALKIFSPSYLEFNRLAG